MARTLAIRGGEYDEPGDEARRRTVGIAVMEGLAEFPPDTAIFARIEMGETTFHLLLTSEHAQLPDGNQILIR